jgi:hypothetical protein
VEPTWGPGESGLRGAPRAGVPGTTNHGSEEPRWPRSVSEEPGRQDRGGSEEPGRSGPSRGPPIRRGAGLTRRCGTLPCREGARRLRRAGGSELGWEEGGRGSEELRHQIPARGRNSGWGGTGGTGTRRRGSEESGGDAWVNRGPNPKIGHGVRGGDSDAVMLRSAEADPHITEHPLGRRPKRPRQRGGNRPEVPGPKLRCRERAIEPPTGTGSFPKVAAESPPRTSRRGSRVAPRPKPWTLRARRRPTEAGRGRARQNLAKQPTSRRCSADESVASCRRCQRLGARFFHGLCGSLQGRVRPAPSRRCQYR